MLRFLCPLLLAPAAFFVPLPGSGPSQDPEPAVLAGAKTSQDPLGARIDPLQAAQWVRDLVALGPRMGGTPSGQRAADFLVERFRGFGLQTKTIEGPASRVHWEDPWTLKAHVSPAGEEAAEVLEFPQAWPYGYSPSGSGRMPLALEATDGVAALFDKAHRPPRKGPELGVALVDGYCTLEGGWPKLIPLRSSARNRYPVFGIGRAAGAALREKLAAGRSIELEWSLTSHIEEASPITVEARLPAAAGAPPGVLVLCAHGDSDAGGPGANDNASGVAVVLSVAQAWSAAVAAGELPAPPREVRFVIWGSEIQSTRHYLESSLAELPCVGVFNWDQAGFGSGAQQLNIEPDDLAANRSLVRSLYGLLEERAGQGGFPKQWATNKSLGGTDSYVFSSSKRFRDGGIPAITLFTSAWDKPEEHPRTGDMPGESWRKRDLVRVDFDHYYHSAGDRPELTTDLEPENLGWCARVGLFGALRWLEQLED